MCRLQLGTFRDKTLLNVLDEHEDGGAIPPPNVAQEYHSDSAATQRWARDDSTFLNDERVYHWLSNPPFPYLPERADRSLNKAKQGSDLLLAELEAAREDPEPKIVDDCPVGSIREVKEDGTEIFLGSIEFSLAEQPWELEGTDRYSQRTAKRDPNDPDIWTGIMSDAFQTLLHQWGIPRMGVRHMGVTTLAGNTGGVRVSEKNGFKFQKTVDDAVDVRGTMRGLHVLDWTLEDAM
ncbi:hypothetical protein B0H11DRAFT_2200218 [Mycena galericulata]|nr:hypothetical protein B0H11DRAFT_2200218 [Mycena galericulata]